MEKVETSQLLEETIEELHRQLEEANNTIEAIRTGQVDALIVKEKSGHQLYTLKSADQTYRVFIEKMMEGGVTLNQQGIILYSNTSFAGMVAAPLPKIIGSYFYGFVATESISLLANLLDQGWKSESKGEINLLSKKGDIIPVLISLATLELDDGLALSLILTDLSNQKQIEQELKFKNEQLEEASVNTEKLNDELEEKVKERTRELLTSREHFKFLADTVPVIIWTATPNGDFDYFNQRWYEYSGKTFEESKGQGWLAFLHPEDQLATQESWQKSIETGEPFKMEDRKMSANGTYRWHISEALPFEDKGGNIIAWFGVCTDIEDQRRAMEMKDEFISMASHELKTPVTSLKGLTQLMIMLSENKNKSQEYNMLVKMDSQINKLTGLIGDLLDASKANIGQLTFQVEKINFNELVHEYAEEMQSTTKTHTIELELDQSANIQGDRNRLGQVIVNLISNAIKYSPGAGKIVVSSTLGPQTIELCIRDFGIGIPAAQHPKLFTRFFRVSKSKTNTFPGLGLGLFICNEIIERHSGTLHFTSEENKGSVFCFSLPL